MTLPGFDDRLKQHLEEVAPPADPSGAFDRILEKKIRRRVVRRLQVAGLAFVVVAATVGGTWALVRAFESRDDNDRLGGVSPTPPSVRNGRIAFISTRGDLGQAQDIYTVDPRTGDVSRLTELSLSASRVSWSPNGQRLVFDRGISEGRGELDVIGADGTGVSTITELGDPQGPVWSPDGGAVAFFTGGLSPIAIYVMESGADEPRQMTHPSTGCSDVDPSWAPDGHRIAFVRECGPDETSSLMVMRLGETEAAQIADLGTFASTSSWSPDGKKIVFAKEGRIFVVSPDGQSLQLLTDTGEDSSPVWAPDGKQIAFSSSRDGNQEIYVMNADGSAQTNITNDEADDFAPSWQPLPAAPPLSPTASTQPPPTPTPFPAECNASQVTGNFDGDGQPDTATVARTDCLIDPGDKGDRFSTEYSLQVRWPPSEGIAPLPDCDNVCKAVAASDLNLDGTDEFVLKTQEGASSYVVQIYELPASDAFGDPARTASPGDPPGFPAGETARFIVGGSVSHYAALGCWPGNNEIHAEIAVLNEQQTEYSVHKTVLRFDPIDAQPFGQFTIVSTTDFNERFDTEVGPGDRFEPGGPCWMEQP
jgi:Tol biopolymer transport system component